MFTNNFVNTRPPANPVQRLTPEKEEEDLMHFDDEDELISGTGNGNVDAFMEIPSERKKKDNNNIKTEEEQQDDYDEENQSSGYGENGSPASGKGGKTWASYDLVDNDPDGRLLADMPADSITSGDKLSLLRDFPLETKEVPRVDLMRDVDPHQRYSSILAQQTVQRNNFSSGLGGYRLTSFHNNNSITTGTNTSDERTHMPPADQQYTNANDALNNLFGAQIAHQQQQKQQQQLMISAANNNIQNNGQQQRGDDTSGVNRLGAKKGRTRRDQKDKKGVDIIVKELVGYFGDKALPDVEKILGIESGPTNGGKKGMSKLAASSAAAASTKDKKDPNNNKKKQKAKPAHNQSANRKSSAAANKQQKQQQTPPPPPQQQRRQQSPQSPEEMDVDIELDPDLVGGGGGEDVVAEETEQNSHKNGSTGGAGSRERQQQQDDQTTTTEGTDGAGDQPPPPSATPPQQHHQLTSSSSSSSSAAPEPPKTPSTPKQQQQLPKTPLLERIPARVLKQFFASDNGRCGWRSPVTICNPFLSAQGANQKRDAILKGPVGPWLERSAQFPLPAELADQQQSADERPETTPTPAAATVGPSATTAATLTSSSAATSTTTVATTTTSTTATTTGGGRGHKAPRGGGKGARKARR